MRFFLVQRVSEDDGLLSIVDDDIDAQEHAQMLYPDFKALKEIEREEYEGVVKARDDQAKAKMKSLLDDSLPVEQQLKNLKTLLGLS